MDNGKSVMADKSMRVTFPGAASLRDLLGEWSRLPGTVVTNQIRAASSSYPATFVVTVVAIAILVFGAWSNSDRLAVKRGLVDALAARSSDTARLHSMLQDAAREAAGASNEANVLSADLSRIATAVSEQCAALVTATASFVRDLRQPTVPLTGANDDLPYEQLSSIR